MESQTSTTSCDDIKRLIALLDDALQTVHMLHPAINETMADDALPHVAPEPGTSLHYTLYREVQQARDVARELFERLCPRPITHFLMGRLLSVEEFHALAADGFAWPNRAAIGLPAPADLSDYELYKLFHYEGDGWRGVIDPTAAPRDPSSGLVGARIGLPPEEIPRAHLRPEQEEFFAKHLPEILRRFA